MDERRLEFPDFGSLAAEILNHGDLLRFRAFGSSMHPFIHDGDLVDIQAVQKADVKRGTIIFCRLNNGSLVIHRVIRARCDALLVQGDAVLRPDGWIPPNNVLGRVVAVKHNNRQYSIDDPIGSFLGYLWVNLLPFRPLIWKILSYSSKLIRKNYT